MNEWHKFSLRDNPFDIFSYEHNMADRKEEWQRVESLLKSAFSGKGPRIALLLGDYGIGKTFILEKIYQSLSKDRCVLIVRGDVLYEKRLAIMESEPRWSKFGLDFITRIFDNIEHEKLISAMRKIDFKKFRSKFSKIFQGIGDNDDNAFKYITGEKVSAKTLQKYEISSPLSDSPTGIELFFEFLRAIKFAGYDNFLMLVDEFEYITSVLGEKKITQILNTFRQIYDDFGIYDRRYNNNLAKPIFMFAISPGGWDSLRELDKTARKKTGGGGIAPFMERISEKDVVSLKAFSLENSLELVQLRLSEARTKEIKNPLSPFTKKCIEFVHKVSFNKPRNVLQYCKILLEDASEEGVKEIDVTDAKKILGKYGIALQEK